MKLTERMTAKKDIVSDCIGNVITDFNICDSIESDDGEQVDHSIFWNGKKNSLMMSIDSDKVITLSLLANLSGDVDSVSNLEELTVAIGIINQFKAVGIKCHLEVDDMSATSEVQPIKLY